MILQNLYDTAEIILKEQKIRRTYELGIGHDKREEKQISCELKDFSNISVSLLPF